MKQLIRKIFSAFGLEVRRKAPAVVATPPVKPSVDSMVSGMQRARDKFNVHPQTVIDLGAAAGTWTIKAGKIWERAHFLMFEPLEERKPELEALHKTETRFQPVFAAVGEKEGTVSFRVSADLDGSAISDSGSGRAVELITLDMAMKKFNRSGPYVIKFDTHGFELPILEGAAETLQKTELIIMECYGFHIASKSLLFHEMCAHLEKSGFRLADIVNVVRRPDDQCFWQCDAFFLRDSHPVFSRNTYR